MEDRLRAAVAAERRELADLLAALPAERWDAPTLCAGWRVREVVAHLTMPFRTSLGRLALDVVRARGSFNRAANFAARRDAAALPPQRLVAALRDNAEHPWTPVGGGVVGALSHDVIHGLDITVALGLDRRVPAERLTAVLTGMRPRNARFFGTDLAGVRLRATDLEWEYGSGTPLHGLAQNLLLVICGRRLPAGHLCGKPAPRFTG
ncbi:maleylpyruvate isomerase family mycothiol-dependent enzyme [Micromonospora sp. KC606]|uniref:maleylpyruvate isomerase family mycothiol-dependent enzyme n=1 Tax=Micromonospora sp. KC606 TaxID=2530379 RepID=UPI001FB6A76A|nr:maleylpyruvate isomerase family mycothiol-dependent enzyme [Micromonospora sp. KC606]